MRRMISERKEARPERDDDNRDEDSMIGWLSRLMFFYV